MSFAAVPIQHPQVQHSMIGNPPHRAKMALDVLQHFYSVKYSGTWQDIPTEPRDLSSIERAVENAALNCLKDYLSGEVDMGDIPYTKAVKDVATVKEFETAMLSHT